MAWKVAAVLAFGVFVLFLSDSMEFKNLQGSDAGKGNGVGADMDGLHGHVTHKVTTNTPATAAPTAAPTAAASEADVPAAEAAADATVATTSPLTPAPTEVPAAAVIAEPVPNSNADEDGTTAADDGGGTTTTTTAGTNITNMVDPPIVPEHYVVHPIYDDDLSYRRVCAPLENSHLCLTVRYPFEIQPQDPTVTYAKPFQEKFYDHLDLPLHMINGVELDYCRQNATVGASSMASAIRGCIDYYYDQLTTETTDTAVACWSRQRLDHSLDFYGIGSEEQQVRMHKFFEKQNLFILGMSPTPPIAGSLKALFGGNCNSLLPLIGKTFGKAPCICSPVGSQVPRTWDELKTTETSWTIIMFTSVLPSREAHHPIHPQLETFRGIEADSQPPKMKFTVVSEHPIAHFQNQDKFINQWDETVAYLDTWVDEFMNEQYNQTRLDAFGNEITRVIAFDGSPQFNPTLSGAYPMEQRNFHSEEDFVSRGGYEGWLPEYGTQCHGFLPPNSNSSIFNGLGRSAYEKYGQDMNLYGRTWEFINLVWYNMKHWNGKGGMLDCTHGYGQVSQMHKYFIMAMVDNYFDDDDEATP
jgi:hypothetical protein